MPSVQQTQAASSSMHEPWQTTKLKRRFGALGPRNSRQILVSGIRISRQNAPFLVSDRTYLPQRRPNSLPVRSNRPDAQRPSFLPVGGVRGGWAFPPNSDPVGSCPHPDQKEFGSGLFQTFDRDSPTRTSGSTFQVNRKGKDFLFYRDRFPFRRRPVSVRIGDPTGRMGWTCTPSTASPSSAIAPIAASNGPIARTKMGEGGEKGPMDVTKDKGRSLRMRHRCVDARVRTVVLTDASVANLKWKERQRRPMQKSRKTRKEKQR